MDNFENLRTVSSKNKRHHCCSSHRVVIVDVHTNSSLSSSFVAFLKKKKVSRNLGIYNIPTYNGVFDLTSTLYELTVFFGILVLKSLGTKQQYYLIAYFSKWLASYFILEDNFS